MKRGDFYARMSVRQLAFKARHGDRRAQAEFDRRFEERVTAVEQASRKQAEGDGSE